MNYVDDEMIATMLDNILDCDRPGWELCRLTLRKPDGTADKDRADKFRSEIHSMFRDMVSFDTMTGCEALRKTVARRLLEDKALPVESMVRAELLAKINEKERYLRDAKADLAKANAVIKGAPMR